MIFCNVPAACPCGGRGQIEPETRQKLVEIPGTVLSIRRQCQLLSLTRSNLYYAGQLENPENLSIMEAIDRQYLKTPFYGIRKMTVELNNQGLLVNHKRVQRLMRLMGLVAIYQKPKTTCRNPQTHSVSLSVAESCG